MPVNKSTLRALIVLELIDSGEEKEEENNEPEKIRNWTKKREKLGCYANIVQELRMKETDGFKEIMWMDLEHFKEMLCLIEPDITPQKFMGRTKVILDASFDFDNSIFSYLWIFPVVEILISNF